MGRRAIQLPVICPFKEQHCLIVGQGMSGHRAFSHHLPCQQPLGKALWDSREEGEGRKERRERRGGGNVLGERSEKLVVRKKWDVR